MAKVEDILCIAVIIKSQFNRVFPFTSPLLNGVKELFR
jgi:hypothetical protein